MGQEQGPRKGDKSRSRILKEMKNLYALQTAAGGEGLGNESRQHKGIDQKQYTLRNLLSNYVRKIPTESSSFHSELETLLSQRNY